MLPGWLVYPGTLLLVWGAASYIRDIFAGRARPNLVTWFLWSLAPLVAFGAQMKDGVGAQAALTLMVGLCPLAVFVAGLKKGDFRPTRFDWYCGGASLIAFAAWQLTGSGAIGVCLSIAADGLGATPTLRKAYTEPRSESPFFFALFAISAAITLLTIEHWTVQTSAFSLYILLLYVTLYSLVKFRVGELYKNKTMPIEE